MLRPYQQKAIDLTLASPAPRSYFTLPTGTGKTVVLSQLTRPFGRAVLLAHRKELIGQIAGRLRADWQRSVGIVMAGKDEASTELVVATPQSLRTERTRGVLSFGAIDALFIDEAHHCTGKSQYARIIEILTESNPDLRVIGCTATPFRFDRQRMQDVLPVCTFSRTIDDMQREGWLCPLDWRRIQVDMALTTIRSKPSPEGMDYDLAALGAEAEREEIVQSVVDQTVDELGTRTTLVFGVTVAHARMLAEAYARAGLTTATVWGGMKAAERDRVLSAWRMGAIQLVANCSLITEGYDFPGIQALVIARPTRSVSLYCQILGRGTRTAPGKDNCLVIDVSGNEPLDECEQVILPDVAEVADEQAPEPREKRTKPGEKSRSTRLLVRDPSHDQVYRWTRTDGGYLLSAAAGTLLVLIADPAGSGLYQLGTLTMDGRAQRITTTPNSIWEQRRIAHDWLTQHGLEVLSGREQPWHARPASEKQLGLLRRLDPMRTYTAHGLSRAEASSEIARALAHRHADTLATVLWDRPAPPFEMVF